MGSAKGVDWSGLPVPVLSACMKHLFPTDLATLARSKCVCVTLKRAVEEVLREVDEVDVSFSMGATPFRPAERRAAWVLLNCPNLKQVQANRWRQCLLIVRGLSACPYLVKLELNQCELSDLEMQAIFSERTCATGCLHFLEELSLASCGGHLFGDGWLEPQKLPNLTSLNLAWCRNMENKWILRISHQLRHLNVHGCEKLDDSICETLIHIESIDLSFTSVTDAGLHTLATAAPKLRQLTLPENHSNLWLCGHWTQGGLRLLKHLRPDVRVDLVSC